MAARTALQICNEKARAVYENDLKIPLLQQICMIYNLSTREFASIFDISPDHAHRIMTHKVFPSMEVGIRIARYFEVEVEFLFGWRVDDFGSRRPLLIEDPESRKLYRLHEHHLEDRTEALVGEAVERGREDALRVALDEWECDTEAGRSPAPSVRPDPHPAGCDLLGGEGGTALSPAPTEET